MPVKGYGKVNRRTALRRYAGSYAKAATAIQRVYRARRGKRVPKTLSLTASGVGLPTQLLMKHQYRLNAINLTDTSFGWKQFLFKANSMFDPENPVGGLQPTLRDNMYAMYTYSRVIGINVKINFFNTGGLHCLVGAVLTDNSSDQPFSISSNNDPRAITKDRAKYTMLSQYGGSKTMATVSKSFSFKHFDSELYSSVNFRADASNDPAKLFYLIVGAQCLVGNNDLQVRAEAVIDFIVRWENPINNEMSLLD